jgi:NitT/TauT family transport system permease protein
VRNLRPVFMTSARSMGAGRWQMFRYVILPHIVPGFFAGLRLAMTAVLLGVLLAELYASSNGIGHFTRQFTEAFEPARLIGLVALVALLAIVLNGLLRRIEQHFAVGR